jgi:osmotically-inducible protein OsmY
MKSDTEIRNNVIGQLNWEPVLHATEINVAVKNGVVTLTGTVSSYSQKIAAERAVKKVAGVKALAENVQVGIAPGFERSDTEIADAVVYALKWNISVPEDKILVRVEDGMIALEGEVDWEYQRAAALNTVTHLAGVKMVHNFITIKPKVTSADIKQKIAAAFERSATVDAAKIDVQVNGRKVTLTGKVRSFSEQEDAINAVWSAPGVSQVENNLELEETEYVW